MPRQRCQARNAAQDVSGVSRPRRGSRVAGILLDPADVSAVPRHRQDHSGAVRDVQRRRPREEAHDRIRLSGEGEAGVNGGPSGDLYVVVNLKPHPVFQRDGADLHCEMPISFTTAALGGEIEIPTLDGHAKITIPTETQTGQVFRLKNKGIRPVRGSVIGDLYCHVALETPVKLTSRQKELLREFESINQQDPDAHSPRAKNWFDKVREFFGP